MKFEWRKHDKNLYGAKKNPTLINIPKQKYIMINGMGNPNDTDFSNRVSALYSLAYAIKMLYKKSSISEEIQDYTVYPLEGIWKRIEDSELIKENLEYTIMIRQPDFISEEMVNIALGQVKKKKLSPFYDEMLFKSMQDGQCVELLHVGAFDDEPISFEKMNQFMKEQGLTQSTNYHREIYLNNANRVEKSKLKTILRYPVSAL